MSYGIYSKRTGKHVKTSSYFFTFFRPFRKRKFNKEEDAKDHLRQEFGFPVYNYAVHPIRKGGYPKQQTKYKSELDYKEKEYY